MNEDLWLVYCNGVQWDGRYTTSQVQKYQQHYGDLLVWKPGMTDWQHASEILTRQDIPALEAVPDAGKDAVVYAGFPVRLFAGLLDATILAVLFAVGIAAVALLVKYTVPAGSAELEQTRSSITNLVCALVYIVYFLHFWGKTGATPGKRLAKLEVLLSDGRTMGQGRAFLRLIGYSINSFFFGIPFLLILFTKRHRGIQDYLAGTVVVQRGRIGSGLVTTGVIASLLVMIGFAATFFYVQKVRAEKRITAQIDDEIHNMLRHTLQETLESDTDQSLQATPKEIAASPAVVSAVAKTGARSVDTRDEIVEQNAEPVLIYKLEPEYSEVARKARIQGTVILSAYISKDGTVTDVRVQKSVHPLLDKAAVEAVRQWRYRPAMLLGRPVGASFTVTVAFTLK